MFYSTKDSFQDKSEYSVCPKILKTNNHKQLSGIS